MKLYSIRHGQTLWNLENKICGVTDLPLTSEGIAQARNAAERLSSLSLDLIISSPMLRARQTAQWIGEPQKTPISLDHRLLEQNYGLLEGQPRNSAEFWAVKRRFAYRYPQGESMLQLAQRVYNLLDELKATYPSSFKLLLVSHGGVCRMIHSYFYDMTNEEFAELSLGNCEIREYTL